LCAGSELPWQLLEQEKQIVSAGRQSQTAVKGRLIKCRFAWPTSVAVAFRVHIKTKTKNKMSTMKTIRILTLSAVVATAAFLGVAHADTKSAKNDIVAVASSAGSFNTLVAAVKAAGLVETLQGAGPFTVFAPTDAAFAKLPKGTVEDLLKPENKEKLIAILTYHVVAGKVMAADVKTMKAKTVNGQSLDVKVTDSGVTVDNAKVVKTDVAASNGIIHVIDTVVLPN
jgi:uncharacterized surface protein with fasciclin (FAS1) repeats